MTAKNIFFGLFFLFISAGVSIYFLGYSPAVEQMHAKRKQLGIKKKQYYSASHARKNIDQIREKYEKERARLDSVQQRFIYRDNLASITEQIKDRAAQQQS